MSTYGTNLWKPNMTCPKSGALTSAATVFKAPTHIPPRLQYDFLTLYGSATQAVVVVTFSHHGAVLKRT